MQVGEVSRVFGFLSIKGAVHYLYMASSPTITLARHLKQASAELLSFRIPTTAAFNAVRRFHSPLLACNSGNLG